MKKDGIISVAILIVGAVVSGAIWVNGHQDVSAEHRDTSDGLDAAASEKVSTDYRTAQIPEFPVKTVSEEDEKGGDSEPSFAEPAEVNCYMSSDIIVRYSNTEKTTFKLSNKLSAQSDSVWKTSNDDVASVDGLGNVTVHGKTGVAEILNYDQSDQADTLVLVVNPTAFTGDDGYSYFLPEGEMNMIGNTVPRETVLNDLRVKMEGGSNALLDFLEAGAAKIPGSPKSKGDVNSALKNLGLSMDDFRKENNNASIAIASSGNDDAENVDLNGNPIETTEEEGQLNSSDSGSESTPDQSGTEVSLDISRTLAYYKGDLDLPSSLTYNGKKATVTGYSAVSPFGLGDYQYFIDDRYSDGPYDEGGHVYSRVTRIMVPSSVKSITEGNPSIFKTRSYDVYDFAAQDTSNRGKLTDIFANMPYLECISVEKGNKQYKSEDGVLFTADGKTLIGYPGGNTDDEYDVPDTVISIAKDAFKGVADLKVVGGGSNVSNVGKDAFMNMRSLQDLQIKTDDITVKDGLMLMDSGHYLSSIMKKDGEVVIPKSVTSMAANIFDGLNGTEKLTIDYNQTDGIFSDPITKISNSSTISELEINGNLDYLEVDNLSNLQKVIVNGSIGLGWIENWDSDNGIVLEINGKVSDLHVAKLDKAIYKGKEYTVDQINDLNGAMGSDSGVSIN